MVLPAFSKSDSLLLLLQGMGLGAMLTMIVGFTLGGWTRSSTAMQQADEQTSIALVSALAPICVDNFRSSKGSTANFATLNKQSAYRRTEYIENGGWAIFPGSDTAGSGVAEACARLLSDLQ